MSVANVSPNGQRIDVRQHLIKIKQYLSSDSSTNNNNAVIYHRGGVTHTRDDTDVEVNFRQESNFFYLSGVEAAGYHILFLLQSEKIHLIRPDVPKAEQLWKGIPDTDKELLERYTADHIVLDSQFSQHLLKLNPSTLYTLDITDTSLIPKELKKRIDTTCLKGAIYEARLTKFPWEISLLRYAAQISSHAHMNLMSHCGDKFRHEQRVFEGELEARFRWVSAKSGLSRQCYIPIIASGPRAAVLHYTDNNKLVPNDRHALILVDAGGEFRCYGSDVTRTFPVSTKFSAEAKTIYNIVLKAQKAVLKRLRPGVWWRDMHDLVVRTLCHELVEIGILVGDEKELLELSIYRAFYFHGTGHSVGLDCHDVGGKDFGILKTRKGTSLSLLTKPLEKDMVVTVEPGLYFNNVSIDLWTHNPQYSKYFDMEKINQYRVVGGVRIEDTVLITEDGIENFTIAPKETDDIEAIMQ